MQRKATHTCHNCDGKGRLAHFAHRHQGRCYTCGGTGEVSRRDDVDGPRLVANEYDDGPGEASTDIEWEWVLSEWAFTHNVSGDVSSMRRDRPAALRQAAKLLAETGGTFCDQWFRVVRFASACWAAGDTVIERGEAAVRRDHGEEWSAKYRDAVKMLRDF